MDKIKIVVFVPESHASAVRKAMGDAGAGEIGNYLHCSFSIKGVGRFLPQKGANPAIGAVGKLEEVPEEKIEMIVKRDKLIAVIEAIKKVHPYEEPAIEAWPLLPL